MAVDVRLEQRARAPRGVATPFARLAALPAQYVLALLVTVSVAVRWLAALGHVTPFYLPDEYVYRALADGIASTGRPSVRGQDVSFPALLEPIVTAPIWSVDDPVVALRLTQLLHVVAVSLAAVPVYLLARRLGLGRGLAFGAAAVALTAPGLVYASFVLADPLAYALAVTAVWAAVRALETPTARAQLLFAALAGLATFARLQYAALALAFAAAALAVERGRPVRALRRYAVSAVAFAVPAAAFVALGPRRLLGDYSTVGDCGLDPVELVRWLGRDGLLLAYGTGWVLVPGALVALAACSWWGASRAERAFGAFTSVFAVTLLFQAAGIAAVDSHRFQERYLIALTPLVALAFGVYVRRGLPHRRAVALISLALLVLSARIPLAGYAAAHGLDDSPTLFAVRRLSQILEPADAALAFAVCAAVLSGVAILAALDRRRGGAVALVAACAATGALSLGAHAHDARRAQTVRTTDLPAQLSWVDRTRLRSVALLRVTSSAPNAALEQLFWNRSIVDVLALHGVRPVDSYGTKTVEIADDGTLREGRRVVRRPLLVQTYSARVELVGADVVARARGFTLWRPHETPRLSVLSVGHYYDGWLGARGLIAVWPDAHGRSDGVVRLTLSLPTGTEPTPLLFTAPGLVREVTIAPGQRRIVEFPVASEGPWFVRFRTLRPAQLGDLRAVSVQAETPVFVRATSRRRAV